MAALLAPRKRIPRAAPPLPQSNEPVIPRIDRRDEHAEETEMERR
jgi:hypothetical protein